MNSTKEIASLWLNDCVISPLGNGHIHDTYLLENKQGESRLVLQRINGQVFPNPKKLMSQTVRVLSYLSQTDAFEVPRLVESRNAQVLEFQEDCYWRAWTFIEGSRTIDPIEKVQQAESAAEAFGCFQCVMEKIDLTEIENPIPGYQQLSYYMRAFEEVRIKAPAELLDTIESNSWLVERFEDVNSVVHGDCKINNVLFDEAVDRVKAIIDLDTVMPGHWAWDFGDFVRSLWFGRKTIDLELFRHSMRGFLCGAPSRSYSPEDFAEAPFYISFMLGIRFLTDHLQGDSYFKVSARGDNLRRALEQFTLLENCVSSRESLLQLATQALEAHER